MDYTLMHKNIPVVDIVLDTYDGAEYVISQLSSAANPAHVPLGINVNGNDVDAYQLNRWWRSRRIPASRHGLDEALDNMSGEPDRGATSFLALSAYGLSLSDQYWICPKGSGLTWDKVNFFTNGFSPDVGEMLFGDHSKNLENIDLLSPDNTSDGVLKKKWIIAEGKRYLVKSGSGVYQQEPYNEAIATTLCRRLGINHIPYAVIMDNDRPCSICENFVTVNTELVPAARVYQSTRRDSKADSPYSHLLKCCDALGIPDVKPALDRMLVLDYLIVNRDRHYNNFGFIRDAESLEWHGLAPIFDSGTSLWSDTGYVGSETQAKPFAGSHDEQIKLASDWSWVDGEALDGIGQEAQGIFAASPFMDDARKGALRAALAERCKGIITIANRAQGLSQTLSRSVDRQSPRNQENDLADNMSSPAASRDAEATAVIAADAVEADAEAADALE